MFKNSKIIIVKEITGKIKCNWGWTTWDSDNEKILLTESNEYFRQISFEEQQYANICKQNCLF